MLQISKKAFVTLEIRACSLKSQMCPDQRAAKLSRDIAVQRHTVYLTSQSTWRGRGRNGKERDVVSLVPPTGPAAVTITILKA